MAYKKIVKDHRDDYPVEWKGETLFISQITIGIKQAFCNWLTKSMVESALQTYGKDTPEFTDFQTKLFASPPKWGTVPSKAVVASLNSEDGQFYMSRLLLGVTTEKISDTELYELLASKDNDDSDLVVAMKLVKENADPKALKPVE
jgi:hypothetical protein